MFSIRTVVGYYLSLAFQYDLSGDVYSILYFVKKAQVDRELDIDAEWQIEGIMDSVHTNNELDFGANTSQLDLSKVWGSLGISRLFG